MAVCLLAGLLALQAAVTALALALRPYISAALNCIEVACGCLETASLSLTVAAYIHTGGAVRTTDVSNTSRDPNLSVSQFHQHCPGLSLVSAACRGMLFQHEMKGSHCDQYVSMLPLQRLDRACTAIAIASIVLQLLSMLLRLFGQLVAVETLVFAVFRPKLLQRLHHWLAGKAAFISAVLHRLRLMRGKLLPGGLALAGSCPGRLLRCTVQACAQYFSCRNGPGHLPRLRVLQRTRARCSF